MKKEISLVTGLIFAAVMTTSAAASSKGSGYSKDSGGGSGYDKGSAMHASAGGNMEALEAVKKHIAANTRYGKLRVKDPVTGDVRRLQLVEYHQKFYPAGPNSYVCADFNDTQNGEMIDLDIHINSAHEVVNILIHKVNGEKRFTYNDKGMPIPVKAQEKAKGSPAMTEKGSAGGSMKGSY